MPETKDLSLKVQGGSTEGDWTALDLFRQLPAEEREICEGWTGDERANQLGLRLRELRAGLSGSEQAALDMSAKPLERLRLMLQDQPVAQEKPTNPMALDYLLKMWLETPGVFQSEAVMRGFQGLPPPTQNKGTGVIARPQESPERERPPRPLTIVVNDINDLPKEVIAAVEKDYGVKILLVPVIVRIGEKEYSSTDPECNQELLDQAKRDKIKVETSVLSPGEIEKLLLSQISPQIEEGRDVPEGRDVLVIPLAASFSGFLNAFRLACEAANKARNEAKLGSKKGQAEWGEARVFASNLLSFAAGNLAIEAARLAREGKNLEQITEVLAKIRERTVLVAALDNVGRAAERLPVVWRRLVQTASKVMAIKAVFQVDPESGEPVELGKFVVRKQADRQAREKSLRLMVAALPSVKEIRPLSLRGPKDRPYLYALLTAGVSEEDKELIFSLLREKNPHFPHLGRHILEVPVSLPLQIYLEQEAVAVVAVRKD